MTSASSTGGSRAAQIAASAGNAAIVFSLFGITLAYAGVVSPFVGFVLLALGLLNGLVGTLTGIAAFFTTRGDAGADRSAAMRGLALSAAVLLGGLIPASAAGGLPRINDITTDLDNPPVFVAAGDLGPNQGRDMSYPGESFARQQLAAYPDLGPLQLKASPNAAMDAVIAAIGELPRTAIVAEDREAGRIEATQTSFLFRFVDDIVVRVVATEAGSKIDIRSKSRDGQGDLGVNAKRIRAIFQGVRARTE